MTKHIATFPLYGSNPITGKIWNKRIGTGYINKPEQIEVERQRLARYGHPLKLRFRNDECRSQYHEWLERQEAGA